MSDLDKEALDRYITGNYGEDQFSDDFPPVSEPDEDTLPADIPDWYADWNGPEMDEDNFENDPAYPTGWSS